MSRRPTLRDWAKGLWSEYGATAGRMHPDDLANLKYHSRSVAFFAFWSVAVMVDLPERWAVEPKNPEPVRVKAYEPIKMRPKDDA